VAVVIRYGNMLASGALSGSQDAFANPVRRVADGSINLPYEATSGSPISGTFEVEVASAAVPDSLVIPRGLLPSGLVVSLVSEDPGGANQALVLTSALAASADFFVADLPSGATPRQVWRVVLSGVSGSEQALVYEATLCSRFEATRRPEVGVARSRERQFTRISVPGGQPFVKRDGPVLRGARYRFPAVSGLDVGEFYTFVEAVEGGAAFTLEDDLGAAFWAELSGSSQPFPDEAGFYRIELGFLEIRAD
jgi:hypothetical protein